jgi:hypothetical protein
MSLSFSQPTTGDSPASRQVELLELAYVALKSAEDYMERQYDGYYREMNEKDRAAIEHAIGQISEWKLRRLSLERDRSPSVSSENKNQAGLQPKEEKQ